MIELSTQQYACALPLFQKTRYGVLAAGTLAGPHPGRVFVDQIEEPRSGLVCSRAGIGYYFLAGTPGPNDLDWLLKTFQSDFIPAQVEALQNPEVLLFFEPSEIQDSLFATFTPCKPVRIQKKRMLLRPGAAQSLADRPARLPDGLVLAPYTRELLASLPELAAECSLFYGSLDAFLTHSFGFCILDGAAAASTCHAVFTGGGEAEISIATAPAYRRRGLAEISAAAFIQACLERGLAPVWGCWPENTPSVGLAHKLGFMADMDQPVCLWVDSPEWGQDNP